jgi:uncharacterized tellurite resistance protein B-like protein
MDGRVARCLVLVEVLTADGIMAEEEKAFLGRAMTRLGLDPEQRRQVFDLEGIDQAAQVVATLPAADRRVIVDELVEAALSDGKLTPQETAVVERLTKALGVDE